MGSGPRDDFPFLPRHRAANALNCRSSVAGVLLLWAGSEGDFRISQLRLHGLGKSRRHYSAHRVLGGPCIFVFRGPLVPLIWIWPVLLVSPSREEYKRPLGILRTISRNRSSSKFFP